MMKKSFLIGIVLALSATAGAQSKFGLKAPDSLAFILKLNDKVINNSPVVEIALGQLNSIPTTAEVTFPSKPEMKITQVIDFKRGGSSYFEVARVKGKYKMAIISESVSNLPELTAPSSAGGISLLPTDTASTDSASIFVEKGFCENPVKEEDFELFLDGLTTIPFESRRLEKMREFANNHCIRTAQLSAMMQQLNTEDLKVRLLETTMANVFDQKELFTLENEVLLEKNKKRVREMIQAWTDANKE